MINLAGAKECDDQIKAELTEAKIPIVKVPQSRSEVPFSIIGKIGPFKFERLWYYYEVVGQVPLKVAQELYADPVGRKEVRVAGHCGCPPPEEWVNHENCISSYHIDSQNGLNLFVSTLQKHGLV